MQTFSIDYPLTMPKTATIDFSLEQAELEMILIMKKEEGLDFEGAVRSALAISGNDALFAFPPDRFPLPSKNVAAVRIKTGNDDGFCYVYECTRSGAYLIAEQSILDHRFIRFAANYAAVLGALSEHSTTAQHRIH